MTVSPVSEATEPSLGDLLAEWRAELTGYWEERFARPLNEGAEHVAVAVGDAELGVYLVKGEDAVEIGRLPRAGDPRELAALLSNSPLVARGTSDVSILLPASQVLRPHLQLPAASRATLRKAAFYELERLSPIDPDQVYFDLVVREVRGQKRRADIELRIIKKTTVDQAVALCRDAGLSVGAIAFEGDAREADRSHFPIDTGASLRLRWRRNSILLLAALAAILFVLLLMAAYWRGSARSDFLSDQAAAAGQHAELVHRLKRDITDTRAQIEFPLAQKRAPAVIQILSEVTQILPRGTWLTEFAFNDSKVHVQGFSNAPSDLIGLIDKSAYFTNAQFEASLQSAQDNAEHFDLSFELKKPGAH
ncbi:MAG TPA: PilN domain-containing protein [Rhizomicrobium sp.]|jgi:general secretion pathway protein L